MDGLLIPILILWFVLSAVSNKKRKQARQEAQRREQEAAQQAQAGEDPAIAPERTVPETMRRTPVPPVQTSGRDEGFDPYFSGPAPVKPVREDSRAARQPLATTMRSMESSMTEAPATRTREAIGTQMRVGNAQHPLEASSLTGHAHMETSLAGRFAEDCPPTSANVNQRFDARKHAEPAVPVAGQRSSGNVPFVWNAEDVTRGILYSEILGKPKALRRRA